MDGFYRCLQKHPTENEDSYCESDLPCRRRLWTEPNQRQCQRPNTADRDGNKGWSKIPFVLFLCKSGVVQGVDKLAAVSALYRFVLNFFSAKGTLFHHCLFLAKRLLKSGLRVPFCLSRTAFIQLRPPSDEFAALYRMIVINAVSFSGRPAGVEITPIMQYSLASGTGRSCPRHPRFTAYCRTFSR